MSTSLKFWCSGFEVLARLRCFGFLISWLEVEENFMGYQWGLGFYGKLGMALSYRFGLSW